MNQLYNAHVRAYYRHLLNEYHREHNNNMNPELDLKAMGFTQVYDNESIT